jgi:hypothetical protein
LNKTKGCLIANFATVPQFARLLRELPSLPSQHAILMGWASELPGLSQNEKFDERAATPF